MKILSIITVFTICWSCSNFTEYDGNYTQKNESKVEPDSSKTTNIGVHLETKNGNMVKQFLISDGGNDTLHMIYYTDKNTIYSSHGDYFFARCNNENSYEYRNIIYSVKLPEREKNILLYGYYAPGERIVLTQKSVDSTYFEFNYILPDSLSKTIKAFQYCIFYFGSDNNIYEEACSNLLYLDKMEFGS